MDEALTHVEAELASSLMTNIKQMGITVIAVTHNPALLELATHRVHLQKNKSAVISVSPEALDSSGSAAANR